MNKRIAFFTIAFLTALSLCADEVIIGEINFHGLKRTKDKTALQIIRPVEIGAPFRENTETLIIQELRETGIFNPEITVETEIFEEEAIINVFLKDRWTLIPVPILSFSQNGAWKAGVLGIESNFLGLYKTLGLGFIIGSEGWSLISFYSDQLFLGTDLTLTAGMGLGLMETIDENVLEENIREYQADETGFMIGVEFPFTEKLSAGGGWNYSRSLLRSGSEAVIGLSDMNATGILTDIKWEDFFYDIPYQYGLLAKLSYDWNWGLDGTENFPLVSARLKWNLNPAWKHLITLEGDMGWTENNPVQKQFRLGGRPGSFTLPMSRIAADEYASSAASYSIPAWYFPGGTLSLKGFYEAGVYKSDLVDRTLYHGPGTGVEIFINDLAIPALQFYIAWNMETGIYQFTAGVGTGGGR